MKEWAVGWGLQPHILAFPVTHLPLLPFLHSQLTIPFAKMPRPFQSYFESGDDSAGSGTSSVHDDCSNVEPTFSDERFDHDTLSIPRSVHTPNFSSRGRPSPPHPSR